MNIDVKSQIPEGIDSKRRARSAPQFFQSPSGSVQDRSRQDRIDTEALTNYRQPGNIELHIEEIVIEGFTPGNTDLLTNVIEGSLLNLIKERGLSQGQLRESEIEWLPGGALYLNSADPVDKVGHQLGKAIYRALKGGWQR